VGRTNIEDVARFTGAGCDAFHVNLARNIYHCFACGTGGTVLDFVVAMERCSLFEAGQKLQTMRCSSVSLTSTPNEKELVTERRRVPLPLKFKLTWSEPKNCDTKLRTKYIEWS
jgi:hypothetical protein